MTPDIKDRIIQGYNRIKVEVLAEQINHARSKEELESINAELDSILQRRNKRDYRMYFHVVGHMSYIEALLKEPPSQVDGRIVTRIEIGADWGLSGYVKSLPIKKYEGEGK